MSLFVEYYSFRSQKHYLNLADQVRKHRYDFSLPMYTDIDKTKCFRLISDHANVTDLCYFCEILVKSFQFMSLLTSILIRSPAVTHTTCYCTVVIHVNELQSCISFSSS